MIWRSVGERATAPEHGDDPMEMDTTAAAIVAALGALCGYQYGTHLRRAAARAVAAVRR
jgi:hypothetical protein